MTVADEQRKWELEVEHRLTRCEEQLKAAEARIEQLVVAVNHHNHDKPTERPMFDYA